MPEALVGGVLEGLCTACVCVHIFLEVRPSVHTTHDREDAVDRTADTNNLHMHSVGPLHGFQHTIETHFTRACMYTPLAGMHACICQHFIYVCVQTPNVVRWCIPFCFSTDSLYTALPRLEATCQKNNKLSRKPLEFVMNYMLAYPHAHTALSYLHNARNHVHTQT